MNLINKYYVHKPFKTILFNFTCKLCLVPYLFSQNSQGNFFSEAEGRSGLVGLPFLLLSAASTSTTLEWTENTGYSELKFIKYINHIFKLHKFHSLPLTQSRLVAGLESWHSCCRIIVIIVDLSSPSSGSLIDQRYHWSFREAHRSPWAPWRHCSPGFGDLKVNMKEWEAE